MNKKKWALLILAALLIFGYIKLFYKTYSETAVAKSADCIIALDVKRITNTLIWNYITTPSQWKTGKLFSKSSDKISWKDMVELPDYIIAFHAANQPANAWYVLLNIKSRTDFEKGLLQFQFEKINNSEYLGTAYGMRILIEGDKVLVGNAGLENADYIKTVADELFNKKSYISKTTLSKAIKANSHMAVYIASNSFLQEDAVITANFNKRQIEVSGTITPNKQYNFAEMNFNYCSTSLCAAGFTQPPGAAFELLNKSNKDRISTALNINVDSVLRQENSYYNLNLAEIKQRTDSAISYTYDEEFNKIETIVVNNIEEPAFNFTITGDSVTGIYNYLHRSKKLERTATGDLFTPMPFVKSYCSKKTENQLAITAANYNAVAEDKSVNAIFFLNLVLTRIPENLQKYLPGGIIQAISNIAAAKISATKNKEHVLISCIIEKKKNDLPIIKF
jgi:hypothetical protein